MKKLLVLTIMSLSPLFATARPYDQVLEQDFIEILTLDLQESFAEIEEMECGPYYDGILCTADLLIIDIVPFGSSQGGGEFRCTETYSYRGGDDYQILESDCL